jgi:myosin heavy subunit
MSAMCNIIESFCSIQTSQTDNVNIFLNVILLEFGYSGQIVSMLVQLINLDQTRLVNQCRNQTNFRIFHQLLAGLDMKTRVDLQLTDIDLDNNLFIRNALCMSTRDTCDWYTVLQSFEQLNFTKDEIQTIQTLLAVVYHLGTTSNQTRQSGMCIAASLLGVTYDQLYECIYTQHASSKNTFEFNDYKDNDECTSGGSGSMYSSNTNLHSSSSATTSTECLKGFCIYLYHECLSLISNCINRAFQNTNQMTTTSLLLIDPPGFQMNADSNNGTYFDLINNYLCERFQLMYYQLNFINKIEKYTLEGLDIDLIEHVPESPSTLVSLLDKPPSILRSVNLQSLNDQSKLGNCGFDSFFIYFKTYDRLWCIIVGL